MGVVKIPDFKRPVGPRAISKKARRASGLFGPLLYIVKSFKSFNQFLGGESQFADST